MAVPHELLLQLLSAHCTALSSLFSADAESACIVERVGACVRGTCGQYRPHLSFTTYKRALRDTSRYNLASSSPVLKGVGDLHNLLSLGEPQML